MCEKCNAIDAKIRHYREIASRVTDRQTLNGIASLIAEQEQQKGAVTCEPEK